ncbi:hypothetical protein [Hyphomicrobium sp. D-2]|uniref:hypothetical protein n=1 Tax=Hyphomicrobium sp. D-2 TaxID=3041621 RepID=UPI002456FB23|nr:hypothetical protein [Hyphomicrobium sp. D-2]MDH4982535.1 hypothetical protein [Hyphomicrobium sp. D-2]
MHISKAAFFVVTHITKRRMFGALAATLLAAAPAYAGGTIPLSDVMEQLKHEPRLIAAIQAELEQQTLDADTLICTGSRFGNHWRELGGARAVPYECEIGGKTLLIDGTVHLFDDEGRELDMSDENAPSRAFDYSQTDLVWSWK